jgi:predicted TIM-barrel fold metal-dependent hydrolase
MLAAMPGPCLPPSPLRRPLRQGLPPGAWDCHVHAIGAQDRFPLTADRSYTPAPAPIERYVDLMSDARIAHAVLVQPSIYGTDNRAMLDALARFPACFRAVAVVGRDVEDATLDVMHRHGVRGVRANLLNRGGISLADAIGLAPRLAARGWHLQLQIDVSAFDSFDALVRLPVPLVVDHFGYMPPGKGADEPGFRRLIDLVACGRCYVKLSAAYRLTAWKDGGYEPVSALARALIAANPARLLWGSDWPHTDVRQDMPDDADLIDLMGTWLPDEALRRAVLVDNPRALYAT